MQNITLRPQSLDGEICRAIFPINTARRASLSLRAQHEKLSLLLDVECDFPPEVATRLLAELQERIRRAEQQLTESFDLDTVGRLLFGGWGWPVALAQELGLDAGTVRSWKQTYTPDARIVQIRTLVKTKLELLRRLHSSAIAREAERSA
jgi:hypothetical protein